MHRCKPLPAPHTTFLLLDSYQVKGNSQIIELNYAGIADPYITGAAVATSYGRL
jgi:hypothetical protein